VELENPCGFWAIVEVNNLEAMSPGELLLNFYETWSSLFALGIVLESNSPLFSLAMLVFKLLVPSFYYCLSLYLLSTNHAIVLGPKIGLCFSSNKDSLFLLSPNSILEAIFEF
jgi:hypothetical protein